MKPASFKVLAIPAACGAILLCSVGCNTTVRSVLSKSETIGRNSHLSRWEALIQTELDRGTRYTEGNSKKTLSFPGWESFPVEVGTYTVRDKGTGAVKSAKIAQLNPSATQLARWIVSASETANNGVYDERLAYNAAYEIVYASSWGIFPVAGVVWEDMEGDGIYKAFVFRNGMTIKIDQVPHRKQSRLTEAEMEFSMDPTISPKYASQNVRIQSTSRADYKRAFAELPVDSDSDWLATAATLYKRAWRSERNDLLAAKLLSIKAQGKLRPLPASWDGTRWRWR